MTDLHHENHAAGEGFEREDLGSRPIFGFLISLVIVGVLIYYVLWGMFHFLDTYNRHHERAVNPMAPPVIETREPNYDETYGKIQQEFPVPRLEDNERTELNDFRYGEEEHLNSYGWVDQSAGVVHIPITRAMELIAQHGLPAAQPSAAPPSPVNMAKQAAAKADVSALPANAAGKKKKGK